MKPRRRSSIRRAFTLVELVATMTVLGAMGSVVSVVLTSAIDGYTRASTAAQLNGELSIAMDRIDQLLRYIPYNGVSGPDIVSVTASSISWQANWSLTLVGGEVLLSENGGSAAVLLSDVTSLSVQAYDENNIALAANLSGSACDPIRRIAITIAMQRNGVADTLKTRVFLRAMATGAGA
jgi:hypothetical protein